MAPYASTERVVTGEYRGQPTAWHYHGVLRDDRGMVIARCDHRHEARDHNGRYKGQAALNCAREMLAALGPNQPMDATPKPRRVRIEPPFEAPY